MVFLLHTQPLNKVHPEVWLLNQKQNRFLLAEVPI